MIPIGFAMHLKENDLYPVALIGAGPIGIEMAVALKQAGITYLQFEKNQIGHTISGFPPDMQFFSSADRIALAGVPIPLAIGSKCTREEYLAYLRSIVVQFDLAIHTYEEVTAIHRQSDGTFILETIRRDGKQRYHVRAVILAVGDMDMPRYLHVPGEGLPHVSHQLEEAHQYFQRTVLLVGGKNSAVEAALRCYHVGARVTISYRGTSFNPKSVKYWLLPDVNNRIAGGDITAHFETVPEIITPTSVTLKNVTDDSTFDVPADFVLLMTGYLADNRLLQEIGVELSGETQAPVHSVKTMETSVPGVYVCGTVTAGNQQSYKVFIENCHIHVKRIIAALKSEPPPRDDGEIDIPES
jgi:thioredoxin reductase (NADPH)